jgi:MFS family permease
MPVLALLGATWAVALLLVPVAGAVLDGGAALALLIVAFAVFAVGECLHGTVQAPLVADLAETRLLGRYMALSAFSWGIGFTLGPAIGGLVLAHAPHLWWIVTAAVCAIAGAASLGLEGALPRTVRRTPLTPLPTARMPVTAEPSG